MASSPVRRYSLAPPGPPTCRRSRCTSPPPARGCSANDPPPPGPVEREAKRKGVWRQQTQAPQSGCQQHLLHSSAPTAATPEQIAQAVMQAASPGAPPLLTCGRTSDQRRSLKNSSPSRAGDQGHQWYSEPQVLEHSTPSVATSTYPCAGRVSGGSGCVCWGVLGSSCREQRAARTGGKEAQAARVAWTPGESTRMT